MSRYGSLSDSLWGAFANPEYSPPQAPEQIWAIREGLHRIDLMRVEWHEVKANKDHICTRGCAIKRNEVYFKLQSGAGWDGELKVCAGCLAMILYFKRGSRIAAVHEDALGCGRATRGAPKAGRRRKMVFTARMTCTQNTRAVISRPRVALEIYQVFANCVTHRQSMKKRSIGFLY